MGFEGAVVAGRYRLHGTNARNNLISQSQNFWGLGSGLAKGNFKNQDNLDGPPKKAP